jgi:hypothetical protein
MPQYIKDDLRLYVSLVPVKPDRWDGREKRSFSRGRPRPKKNPNAIKKKSIFQQSMPENGRYAVIPTCSQSVDRIACAMTFQPSFNQASNFWTILNSAEKE